MYLVVNDLLIVIILLKKTEEVDDIGVLCPQIN